MFITPDIPATPGAGAGVGAGPGRPHRVAFGPYSPNLSELDVVITRLVASEYAVRAAEAERHASFAQLDAVARREAAAELGGKASERAAEDSLAYRAARAEAAVALHYSESMIDRRMVEASNLAASYPATMQLLESGEVSDQHITVILDAGRVIGPDGPTSMPDPATLTPAEIEKVEDIKAKRAAYEVQVLTAAVTLTAHQLRPVARRIAETYALEDLDTRYERAKQTRSVWVRNFEDGLSQLTALLPTHEAHAIKSRLLQMSKKVKATESERTPESQEVAESPEGSAVQACPRRMLTEIQADLLSDLLLNGTSDTATGEPGAGGGIRGIVQLVAYEEHFTDGNLNDADTADAAVAGRVLPELEGYGPIPVGMAQDIAAGDDNTWSKVKVSLRTGVVLAVDTYRPSEVIRRFLAARDARCRFPGCRIPVHRCDFDHTIDAALGGVTSTNNLGALCRGHHILKHHSGWNPKQRLNGDYEWTSPTGRTYIDEPVSRVRFLPVPDPVSLELPDSTPKVPGLQVPGLQGTAPPDAGSENTHPF